MKKKITSGIGIVSVALFFIFIISQKKRMNQYLSQSLKDQLSEEVKNKGENMVDSLYNYENNGESYELTFLEFGSENCISCRKMKRIMEKVKANYKDQIKVVFVNSMKKDNKEIMDLFGIATIPTQVLLGRNGEEYYRHSGYISFEDLSKEFK